MIDFPNSKLGPLLELFTLVRIRRFGIEKSGLNWTSGRVWLDFRMGGERVFGWEIYHTFKVNKNNAEEN